MCLALCLTILTATNEARNSLLVTPIDTEEAADAILARSLPKTEPNQ